MTRRRAPERAITCYKRKVHSAWGDFTDHDKLCVGSRDHESSDPKVRVRVRVGVRVRVNPD